MLEQIIDKVLKNRLTIFILVAAVALYGYFSFRDVPIDSFPDVSPTLVQVFTSSPGLSPVDVETQISYPIEISMYGLPKLDRVQSTSIFGLSRVNIYFEEGTDIYFARRLVNERLSQAKNEIPDGLGEPQLGPITTGLGTVLMYEVKNKEGYDHSLMDIRTAQDWIVKPQLRTVPGVTGVLSIGGDVRQFQVKTDMNALVSRGLTLEDLEGALNKNNRTVGASFLERGGEEYLVRGYGWIQPDEEGLNDLENIIVSNENGTPVYVKDVAEVAFGSEIKRGTLVANGEESVGGFVLKLIGTNTQDLLAEMDNKVDAINSALPEGMVMETFYSQGELVEKAVGTVTNALYIGAILVLIVLYFFMGDIRSTLIIISTVPIAFLIAFIGMKWLGISANLMSLGGLAISIGMIGDSATVIVENTYRLLEERKEGNVSLTRIVSEAAREVIRPVFFATSIIIIVFLPLFSLEGVEGKMFKPLAYTITFALFGAIFLALTYIPIISSFILPEKGMDKEPWLVRTLKKWSEPLIEKTSKYPKMVFGAALVLFAGSMAIFPFLGTEFQPTLREGTYAVRSVLPPGANLPTTTEYSKRLQESMLTFPEVESVYSRVGRAEVGGDPEPVNVVFNVVNLKPLDAWEWGRDYEELQTAMAEKLSEDLPGVSSNFSQPIQLRTDELLSGVRAQVVVSLYGDDLDVLAEKAGEIQAIAEGVEGAVDVRAQQQGGKPQILVRPDREQLARLGISMDDFLNTVETGIGGSVSGQVFEGIRRFDIFVRLQESQRTHIDQVRDLPIRTAKGALVPLSQIADVEVFTGPKQISRNKASRRTYVQLNVRGRDMGSVVSEIQQKVAEQVELPAGYFTEYGGQFENQQRAMARLYVVVPITLGLIFFMLFSTFSSWKYAVLIFLNIPFATIGGIVALWVSGLYLSVPAAVGFIAIFGIAVLNGVVLVSYINQLREEGLETHKAVVKAALLRLRPVLMTALTTGLGLIPLLLANDIGSNVQRPLAAVVVGGLVTSTLLTLVVLPTIYKWFAEPVEHVEL
ncbi:MAG: efflux RND transporter permease subunit [Gracilimonas sp.]|uniref:efflux RND transporter permease subunit n=1 Tax=Gracilimonas sp. TaxID=1974203 RepID=UPI001B23C7C8|nr:CusA/CzcA family heavy metal efflux RND transporter [Gracilimonas sp.]MBO6585582.1 efflux RND transporter permease subunit [Gracilimonas sp.]MBO6616579.1 efflux RND transporter permease subunit [Gracilimonas sp.]